MEPYEPVFLAAPRLSSEDVRCFFHTMAVPKMVPQRCLPPRLQGREVYLAAKVLPMGFLNFVSLAQHVHRNLALWSGGDESDAGAPSGPGSTPRRQP